MIDNVTSSVPRIGWRGLLIAIVTLSLAFATASCSESTAQGVFPAGTVKVLALGDSVTSGARCACDPFPELYAAKLGLRRDVPTVVDNFGVGGLDSAELLARIRDRSSNIHRALPYADIVLVTIGANDFSAKHGPITRAECSGSGAIDCVQDELASMRANIAAILRAIAVQRHHAPTTVLVTGYWAVFEDGATARASFTRAGIRATQALTRQVNSAIRHDAATAGDTYVGLIKAFRDPRTGMGATRLLASDGDHPNAAGHRVIARELLAAGLRRSRR